MAINQTKVAALVKQYGRNDKDTGSSEVQISILTTRINELTAHLKLHPKDHHGHRGLLVMVGKRRGFLDYLERTNREGYLKLIESLKLRK
jgi:small subunit ribosomal protein S15